MFSTDSFIQLVFANEGDTYYCDSLLKLNLNQYLWLSLHEKYQVVYFLSASDGQLYVRDFGDKDAKKFAYNQGVLKKFTGKGNANQFCRWLKEQLVAKTKRCAVVCAMDDLCAVFEAEAWKKAFGELRELEKATGTFVMVAPPIVERSRALLLDSDIFELLGDRVIVNARKGIIRNYYASLKSNKGESCVFLNLFTKDRIRTLLDHVLFESGRVYPGDDLLGAMAEYLTQYLNNRALQLTEHLFGKHFDTVNVLYCELFDQLMKDSVWKELELIGSTILSDGGIASYMAERSIDCVEEYPTVRISYEKGSYAWKCMTLHPAIMRNREDDFGEPAQDTQLAIYRELCRPQNRTANAEIAKAIETLLMRLHNAQQDGDNGTYKRVLYSIHFCVKCLYTPPDSQESVGKIINLLDGYTILSSEVYQTKRSVLELDGKSQYGLPEAVANQLKAKKQMKETLLAKYDSIIPVSIATGIQYDSVGTQQMQETVEGIFDELNQKLNEPEVPAPSREEVPTEEEVPVASPDEEKSSEPDEDFVFEFSDGLFDYKPPTIKN